MGDSQGSYDGPGGSQPTKAKTKYIGIYIPQEDWVVTGETSCVVTSFKEMQAIVKRNPRARFTLADTEEDAMNLVNASADTPVTTSAEAGDIPSPEKEIETKRKGRRGRLSLSALDNISKSSIKPEVETRRMVGEEKDTRFPTPKCQELALMGREISSNKTEAVIAKVKQNPRFLITDSDVPTTVQEGCRYNALHMAAKCNNKEACAFIIDTVSSFEFMKLMYPKDNPDIIKDRIKQIVNAYLNTPDKMGNETPLHFACKFLAVGAVEVLVSHPSCIFDSKNLYGEIAASIIGSRSDPKAKDFGEKKDKIAKLLRELYIVPIWRDPLAVLNPVVGEVASLRKLGECIPSHFLHNFPNLEISVLGPCDNTVYPREGYVKPKGPRAVFEVDVQWEIKAYGGPTDLSLARQLHADLRLTCGRGYLATGKPAPPPVLYDSRNRPIVPKDQRNSRRGIDCDDNRSPQCTPPRRNNEENSPPPVSPLEYSPMVNLLRAVGSPISPGPKDILTRRMDPDKGLERIARKFSVQLGIKWNEEWSFLNFFGDVLSPEGLDILESYLVKVEFNRKEFGRPWGSQDIDGTNSKNDINDDGKITGKFADLCVVESPFCETGALSTNNSFDEVIIRMRNLELSNTGYPTPTKIAECLNKECKLSGRFCNCTAVVPSLYFMQQRQESSTIESSPSSSSCSYNGESSGGFELNNSGDSFFRKPVTNPIPFGITRLDEHPRQVKDSFQSSDSENGSPGNNSRLLDLSKSVVEEENGFHSACDSSSDDSLEYFECQDEPIYLNGSEPCKQDYQLYSLIKDDEQLLSDLNHILVFQWFYTMKALGDRELRLEASTPLSEIRSRSGVRVRDFPTFQSTPKKLHMT